MKSSEETKKKNLSERGKMLKSLKTSIVINWLVRILRDCCGCDSYNTQIKGRRGRDRVVVGFTTTYAISAYYH